jgi:hypothetical protein
VYLRESLVNVAQQVAALEWITSYTGQTNIYLASFPLLCYVARCGLSLGGD